MFAEISSYFVAMRDYAPRLAQNFTMAGLTDFMETGWVAEIPRFMMKGPLTPAQRLTILSGLIHGVRDGHVPAHLIRTDRLPLPRQIMLTAYSEQNVTLHYYRRDGSIFLMQPKEAGVRDAFRDFLTWLPESHLVYSAEETLSQLVACYKKYTKQFRLPIPLD